MTAQSQKIVLTTRQLPPKAEALLSKVTAGKFEPKLSSELDKPSDLSRVEVVLLDTARTEELPVLTPESIARFPNLKLIQSTRAGIDVVQFDAIPMEVTVCGNIGAYSEQIAEHVFGMILYLARNIGASTQALARGSWVIPHSMFLKGKNILVLGAGGIGEAVGKLASCYGMHTVGVNTTGKAVPGFSTVISMNDLDVVLKEADVVVIALPLTVKTFELIDESKLKLMKPSCVLINVARGYIIKEKDLYAHLKTNPDFKSGLDVWWHYPKKGEIFAQKYPFLELPNFVGTPHNSGVVPETEEIALLSAIENIGRFARDEKLRGIMNRNDYLGLKQLIARAD